MPRMGTSGTSGVRTDAPCPGGVDAGIQTPAQTMVKARSGAHITRRRAYRWGAVRGGRRPIVPTTMLEIHGDGTWMNGGRPLPK